MESPGCPSESDILGWRKTFRMREAVRARRERRVRVRFDGICDKLGLKTKVIKDVEKYMLWSRACGSVSIKFGFAGVQLAS